MSQSGIFKKQLTLKEIGEEGQSKLRNSKVLIIGAGALSHPVASYLGAAGVGDITIADHDSIELSDLQRQVLFSPSQTGLSKSICMQETLLEHKPWSNFGAVLTKITTENIFEEIEDMDLVIDCSNHLPTSILANDACYLKRINLITSSINEFSGTLHSFGFSQKRKENTSCLRCLEHFNKIREKSFLGASAGIVGSIQAQMAIHSILNFQDNQLNFEMNLKNFEKININQDQNSQCKLCSKDATIKELLFENYHQCIDHQIFIKDTHDDDLYIDIRSIEQRDLFESNIQTHHSYTTKDEFLCFIKKYLDQKRIVLICEKGIISQKLAHYLYGQGIKNIVSLYGGFDN